MYEIIKIEDASFDSGKSPAVNARELHTFVESKARFSDWIKKRISDYNFVEGTDYTKVSLPANLKIVGSLKNVALGSTGYDDFGQNGRIEYFVTIGMAKELAMVERNDKGREVRKYFIECEKRLKQNAPSYDNILNDPVQLRTTLLAYTEKVIALENKVEAQKPAVEWVDRFVKTDGLHKFREVAKELGVKEQVLRNMMYDQKIIYKTNNSWLPKQVYIDSG